MCLCLCGVHRCICTEPDDASKVAFISAAMQHTDYFNQSVELDADLEAAVKWISERTVVQAGAFLASSFKAHMLAAGYRLMRGGK